MLNTKKWILIILLVTVVGGVIQYFRIDVLKKIDIQSPLLRSEIYEAEKSNNDLKEKFLVLIDGADEMLKSTRDNVYHTLDYMKCSYEVVDVNVFTQANDEYDYLIVILSDLEKVNNIEALFAHVFNGGKVYFPYRIEFSSAFSGIYRYLGIDEFSDFHEASGLNFKKEIMFNVNDLEDVHFDYIKNSSISVQLNNSADIKMISADNTYLFWTYKYGRGEIAYFNGSMLSLKENRGMLFSFINSLREIKIYPVINSKLLFLDSFPSPISSSKNKKIDDEFQRSIKRFYKEVWWPDMVEIASRFDYKYTASLLGTYDTFSSDGVKKDGLIDKELLAYFTRELFAVASEIGMNGYNRIPLKTSGDESYEAAFRLWSGSDDMYRGLDLISSHLLSLFDDYNISSYVAPSNILGAEGRQVLISSGINIISALYSSKGDQTIYEQEFEIKDGVIEFPRITYGYFLDERTIWEMLNGVTSHGVFSHYIYSDDILDEIRSKGLGWNDIHEEYYKLNKYVNDNYSFLDGQTISDASRRLIQYSNLNSYYSKENDKIEIYSENLQEDEKAFYFFQSEKNIIEANGCSVIKIDSMNYFIIVDKEVATLKIER